MQGRCGGVRGPLRFFSGNGGAMICYMHDVECANETPFDLKVHTVCLMCARKLEVMGESGLCWVNRAQNRSYAITARSNPFDYKIDNDEVR